MGRPGETRHRALLAVYDKRGIVELGRELVALDWDLIATGGTAQALVTAGLPVTPVAAVTGIPEMLGGRVKVFHPNVFGGILFRRGFAADEAHVAAHHIPAVDLVAENVYPFVETVRSGDPTLEEALQLIDIGGPAIIRAAAKNFPWVLPLVDPADYAGVLAALRAARGSPVGIDVAVRRRLAAKVFAYTADYDRAIAAYLSGEPVPAGQRPDAAAS